VNKKSRKRRKASPATGDLGFVATPTVETKQPTPAVPARIERVMTPTQLANYLQVSRSTIGRLVKADKIPYVRVGQRIRFRHVAVLDALSVKKKG
jgi:excisionase family DNA binding protein